MDKLEKTKQNNEYNFFWKAKGNAFLHVQGLGVRLTSPLTSVGQAEMPNGSY